MSSDPRKNLAVMFTDITGFTGHMEKNEAEALEMISQIRENLIPLLESHSGTLVKEMGDGTLSVFESSRDAVRCSRALQRKLYGKAFSLRIGIHRGSVCIRPGDVLGDTVNVASRLEKMAPPGGICISGELLNHMGGGRKPAVQSLGLQQLKGLGRLIDLYTLKGTAKHPLPCFRETTEKSEDLISLAGEVPSVAVMPLSNLGRPGDEFYARGISADIVSQLAAAGGIAIAPLNDVIKLRKVVSSGADIASRLSVRFFVIGSLLRSGKHFQLSVELHDTRRRKLIWTDSWTDDWFELPSIKVKVADSLLKVLGVHRAFPVNEQGGSDEYELYLKAGEIFRKRKSIEDVEKARELLEKALKADPELVNARILLGSSYTETGDYDRAEKELKIAYETAQFKGDRAGHIDALNWIGVNQSKKSNFLGAKHTCIRTLMLSKTLGDLSGEARALSNIGLMECNLGEYDNALEHFQRALEVPGVSSMGILKANTLCNIGLTHWSMGDNESAAGYYKKALELFRKLDSTDGQATMMMNLGIVNRSMGRFQSSIEYAEKALELHTEIGDREGQCRSIIGIGNTQRFTGKNDEALKCYEKALEIASDIGDRMTCGIAETNMGDIMADRGDYLRATELYREALVICEEIGDKEGEGENLGYLGISLKKLGKTVEAVDLLRRSISILEDINAMARTALLRVILADALLTLDPNGENLKEALEQAKMAEQIINPGMNDLIKTSLTLSDLYKKLSDIPSAGSSKKLKRKSREFLSKACDSLLRTADSINDEELKASFLGIRLHKRIIDECTTEKLIDS